MYAHEDWLIFLPLALDECEMLLPVTLLTEGDDAEMTVFGRHVDFLAHLDERFLAETVGYEVLDGDNLQLVLMGEDLQLGHAGHGAIVVHDLHECASRVEACQFTEVDGGFGMSAATQHTVLLGIEGVDMAWTTEGLGCRRRVGEGTDGGGTVVGRYACGAPLQLIDSDGKGGAQHRGVVLHLTGQVELLTAADGDGCTEHATGVLQHEVHHLGGDLLGGTDEVALVLTVFVIDHNDELAFTEIFYGSGYGTDRVHRTNGTHGLLFG